MAAEPRPEMLDNKSQLNLILIPLNLNLTPTHTYNVWGPSKLQDSISTTYANWCING